MRKTKLNFLTKLLLVSVSLILYGCLNEDLVDKIEHEHKHRYDTELVSINKVPHIKPHLDNFQQKHSAKSASIDHLDLNQDRILVLSDAESNYKSYSIGINNEIPPGNIYFFDNLYIIEQDQLIVDNFIFRYIPDDPAKKVSLNDFSGVIQYYDVEYNLRGESTYINGLLQDNNSSAKSSSGNYDASEYYMDCEVHTSCACKGDPYCGCNGEYRECILTSWISCSLGSGGGNGSGDGSSGDGSTGGEGGGGGTDNTGNNNDGYTGDNGDPLHPVIPLPEMEDEDLTPCGKLKNLFSIAQLNVKNTILNDLRPNIETNETGEKGSSLKKSVSNYGYAIILPTTDANIKIPTGGNNFSAIHTHPLSTFPMFSWSDVYSLYQLNNGLSVINQGKASFLLVCKDQNDVYQTYAIVFNNEGVNILDLVFNSPMYTGMSHEKIAAKMNEKLKKKYLKEQKNGTFDYAKAFLNQFSGSNVSLYKADSTLDNWSRIHINTATNNSTEIPCE